MSATSSLNPFVTFYDYECQLSCFVLAYIVTMAR